jgi:hypothetical protein
VTRRYNLRLFHADYAYTAEELMAVARVRRPTVCRWKREGLQTIDDRRPQLFLGSDIRAFLAARAKPRQPLAPGELYCTPCKRSRFPLGKVVQLVPRAPTNVDFHGICPVCRRPMFRRVRTAEIGAKLGPCRIADEDVEATISGSAATLQIEHREEAGA